MTPRETSTMRNYEYYSLVSMEDVENDFTVPRIMYFCIDVQVRSTGVCGCYNNSYHRPVYYNNKNVPREFNARNKKLLYTKRFSPKTDRRTMIIHKTKTVI